MAIIVDKMQKKRDIALSCKDLFVQNSIKNLTISQIAKTANIGKGSLYDYFKNKEEIVFELMNILMHEHDTKKQNELSKISSTKDKIKSFADFFYNEEDKELRELYKGFLSISLTTPNEQLTTFQTQCFNNYNLWMNEIIQEGINKGEIIPESINMVNGFHAIGKGFFLISIFTNTIDSLENEMNNYIDTIFTLMEVKNEK